MQEICLSLLSSFIRAAAVATQHSFPQSQISLSFSGLLSSDYGFPSYYIPPSSMHEDCYYVTCNSYSIVVQSEISFLGVHCCHFWMLIARNSTLNVEMKFLCECMHTNCDELAFLCFPSFGREITLL